MGQPEGRKIAHVRREGIAEALRVGGSISVAEIEQRFGVSSMTARRDLADLERRGLARRTHGGAIVPSSTSHEDSFQSRLGRSEQAKVALGDAAAELVTDGQSLFLDSSSTAFHVARALLAQGRAVTLLTNSQPIMELVGSSSSSSVELIGIGGSFRRLTRSFVGPVATAAIAAHYADRVFFSVKGLTRDGVLTDADPLEAEVKRAMVDHADEPVLLLDRTKLESRGLSVIAGVTVVQHVLTAGIEADDLAPLVSLGVPLQSVPTKEVAA